MGDSNGNGNGKDGDEEQVLTTRQALMLEALSAIEDMIADIEADKSPTSREFSIVRTKLEEAEMWLVRGFEVAGIDIGNIGDDEDDEGEDEGEGDEEAEEGGE